MPAILTRLTRQLASRGVKSAAGVAKSLLKKRGQMTSDGKLTAKGKKRQALGNAGRAKDRSAKYSGGKAKDYKYNAKTNRATKK
jgi:hypothetical protein